MTKTNAERAKAFRERERLSRLRANAPEHNAVRHEVESVPTMSDEGERPRTLRANAPERASRVSEKDQTLSDLNLKFQKNPESVSSLSPLGNARTLRANAPERDELLNSVPAELTQRSQPLEAFWLDDEDELPTSFYDEARAAGYDEDEIDPGWERFRDHQIANQRKGTYGTFRRGFMAWLREDRRRAAVDASSGAQEDADEARRQAERRRESKRLQAAYEAAKAGRCPATEEAIALAAVLAMVETGKEKTVSEMTDAELYVRALGREPEGDVPAATSETLARVRAELDAETDRLRRESMQ